jgi:hypothetical protein
VAWHGSIGRAQASTGGRERFADLEYVCTVSQVWRAINASLLAYCSRCKALGSFLGKAERNPQRKVEGKERNGWAEDEGKRDKGKQGQARSQQAEAAFSPMPHARGGREKCCSFFLNFLQKETRRDARALSRPIHIGSGGHWFSILTSR